MDQVDLQVLNLTIRATHLVIAAGQDIVHPGEIASMETQRRTGVLRGPAHSQGRRAQLS